MKKILSFLALTVALSFGANAQENMKMKVGEKAPELAFANPDGTVIKLSEVNKGRYVLIDFWASWCGPCRAANPELVKMYDEYKTVKLSNAPQGFTVFSVSLDKSKDAWKAAIVKDKLAWEYHVSDLGGWGSEAAAIYGVQFIPQAFLIAPDGKIVGKYMNALQAMTALGKAKDNGAVKKAKTTKKKISKAK